jgi:hypothetical protein
MQGYESAVVIILRYGQIIQGSEEEEEEEEGWEDEGNGKGDDNDADGDSDDALSRRIQRQSAKLLRLLQGASNNTQLSEPELAVLRALSDARRSTIEAGKAGPVESTLCSNSGNSMGVTQGEGVERLGPSLNGSVGAEAAATRGEVAALRNSMARMECMMAALVQGQQLQAPQNHVNPAVLPYIPPPLS